MSDKRLQDKVCIVTGSTGGIGEAIAVLFAEHGAKVVVSGRNRANGEAVADQIAAAGNTAIFIRCDVGDDRDCEALVRETVDRFGGLDVLVNNAAATDLTKPARGDVAALEPDSWDQQMRVNLRAVYYLSHLAIPLMRRRGAGNIVNISSVGSMVGWPGAAAYLAAKGGMNQLTRSMAIDYAADNIRVNAICPGWILTPVEERRIEKDPDVTERLVDRMGIQRIGTPREVAFAVLFAACDESSYMTGAALVVDGGWTLR